VDRLATVLEDERVDEEERADLHEIMREIVGHPSPDYFTNTPTTFPLTKPEPEVIFDLELSRWLAATKLEYYRTWRPAILERRFDPVRPAPACDGAFDKLRKAGSAQEKYEIVRYDWSLRQINADHGFHGDYPQTA